MKKILVATDFSDAAQNALSYAISLAKGTGADVHLYHVYKLAQEIPESYLVHTAPDKWPAIKEQLEAAIKAAAPPAGVTVTFSGDHGNAPEYILKEAARVDATLIVCGMKYKAAGLQNIFGSVATAIARSTTIPLMIVPHKSLFQQLHHIALACDTDPHTQAATVSLLAEITKQFSSDLSVVLISQDTAAAKYQMHLEQLPLMAALKDAHPVLEISEGDDVSRSLVRFAGRKGIDLLAVIARRHTFFERLFGESITRKLAFHSHIPLLILPQQKML